MNNDITYIYIVTDFGSYGNDHIYPPDVTAFIDRVATSSIKLDNS